MRNRNEQPEIRLTPRQRLENAVDELNDAWEESRSVDGNAVSPWIDWKNNMVVLRFRRTYTEERVIYPEIDQAGLRV